MHRSSITLALLLLTAGAARAEEPQRYDLADLKALAESQGWTELLEHANDLRPSERKGEWKALLEKAAVGELDALQQKKKSSELLEAADKILTRFPALKSSKTFMTRRRETGLPAFLECFNNPRQSVACVQQIEVFSGVDPEDSDLQLGAAKIVIRGGMWASAPRFFARAFDDPKQRKTGCSDESLGESLVRAFGQPADSDNTRAAAKVAFEQCFDALRPKLLEAFYASGGYESMNLCAGLMKKKAKLSAFQLAYCKDQAEK